VATEPRRQRHRVDVPLFILTLASVCPVAFGSGESVELKRSGDSVEVLVGGRAFSTYYFSATAKPYLFPLRSAEGTVVTRSFPMVTNIPGEDRDEPHQRAMYFAHGDINGFDFWGEAGFSKWSRHSLSTFGRTVFRKLDEMQNGPDSSTLRAEFDLITQEGKAIAEETQGYIFRGDERSRTIDCEFTIHASHGPVRMGDTKEGMFAIRLVKALKSPPGHMMNSNGAVGEKAIWGRKADWVDYYGSVEGEELGVAIFDHPQNLRHPSYWHARAYGLLAANPFGIKKFTHGRDQVGSYTIPADGSLTFRYRVLIHHGDYRQGRVAEAYKEYASGK
jgi:Family of unknown function (DUF6807)